MVLWDGCSPEQKSHQRAEHRRVLHLFPGDDHTHKAGVRPPSGKGGAG